ncbi:MAG: hypothetical protein AAGI34_03235 [Pseudomonadota bacterium]
MGEIGDRSHTRGKAAPSRWDTGFGGVVFIGAVLCLTLWFPNDIRTGFLFVNTIGREEPGDAFFPVLLAATLAFLGALQILLARRARPSEPGGSLGGSLGGSRLTRTNLAFLTALLAIVAGGLVLMYWLGPLTVAALGALDVLEGSYRNHSDSVPYKYLGFVAGGFCLALGLIGLTEGRVRRTAVLATAAVLLASILIFDVFLQNVLLPPNGEF